MAKNIDELIAKDEEMKWHLASVEKKIYEYRKLADLKVQLDKNIEKFEDFIAKTQSDSQKEKEIYEQMMEELKQKETEFKTLQEEVSKKQDEYDAQGFDGKEHLSYLENQKEELADKLDIKRIIVELKHKCWEVEADYLKRCTEVIDGSKSAGRMYNYVINDVNNILNSLSMTNLDVQKSCRSFHLDFPVWKIYSNENLETIKYLRNTLEDIIDKIISTGELIRSIYATMDEKLTEIEMMKSEVSMKLKLFIQEMEQELTSKRKIVDDEISSLKVRCEKIGQSIKSLQVEKSELEKELRNKIEEKNALHELRERKKKELKELLIQKK